MSFALRIAAVRCITPSSVMRLSSMRSIASLSHTSTLRASLLTQRSTMLIRKYTTENSSSNTNTRSTDAEEVAPIIEFDKMKEIALESSNPETNYVIVDVREADEFTAGHIPNAINIPVKSAPGALGLHEDEFKLRYGYDKPSTEKTLVFYCLAGVRANIAEELAYTFGYNKRLNYAGSFGNWVEKNGAIEIPQAPEQFST